MSSEIKSANPNSSSKPVSPSALHSTPPQDRRHYSHNMVAAHRAVGSTFPAAAEVRSTLLAGDMAVGQDRPGGKLVEAADRLAAAAVVAGRILHCSSWLLSLLPWVVRVDTLEEGRPVKEKVISNQG